MIPSVLLISLICLIPTAIQVSSGKLNEKDPEKNVYGVIVDCGSSGTRAHLYEWDSGIEYPQLLHDIEPMRDGDRNPIQKKITPGLSTLADKPDKASDYIQPIIDFITSKIPASRFEFTGVYILATAGMRLLEKQIQKSIMDDIARHLRSEYDFAKVSTSVISGADEGMYQWISVNAKEKRFLEANTNPRTPTFAIIEMGGASIQITYQLRPGMYKQLEDWLRHEPAALEAVKNAIVEPSISRGTEGEEHNFKLVSVTFLGFGSNSARDAYLDVLIKNLGKRWYLKLADKYFNTFFARPRAKDRVLQIQDPCMPKGTTDTAFKPVRMLNVKNSIGFTVNEDDETFKVELRGSGNLQKCRHLMRKVLTLAKEERLNCDLNEPCTMSLIGTNFVPFHRFHFLGLAEFYYTTSTMNLDGDYDSHKIHEATKKLCSLPYDQLKTLYPHANDYDSNRLKFQCFKAVWMDTFLTEGINMPKKLIEFSTVGKVNGDALEWTLGAVLDKSLAIDKAVSPLLADKWDESLTRQLGSW